MDATTAAAVLAIVAEESQQSAMEALLREREQLAMALADRESYLAQRHWVGSLQVPQHGGLMTWETAFTQRHNDLVGAHQVMSAAVRDLRNGDDEAALSRLTAAVGDDNSEQCEDEEMIDAADEEEEEEEEAAENDAEVSLAQSE